MKYLIIARHGNYAGRDLDSYGEEQMRILAGKIKMLVGNASIALVSSTAPRAIQSATIISEILSVPVESHEILWSDNSHRKDDEKAYEIIVAKKDHDVVIMVTHLEYSDDFPTFFSSVEGWNRSVGYGETEKGQAWVLDCENQTKKLL